jgi:hypothetical protein
MYGLAIRGATVYDFHDWPESWQRESSPEV